MELKQLEYFLKVAQLEHITKAAEELDVSQPYLSKMISNLEKELKTNLFTHEGRKIQLNEQGKILEKHARSIFQELLNLNLELEDSKNESSTCMVIATNISLYMLDLLAILKEIFPTLMIKQVSVKARNMKDFLMRYNADLAIVLPANGEFPLSDNFHTSHYDVRKISVICCQSHPLAKLPFVTLENLMDEKFVTVPKGYGMRVITDVLFDQANHIPEYSIETTDSSLILQYVAMNFGISFFPTELSKRYERDDLCILPLEHPELPNHITLAWNKKNYHTKQFKHILSFIENYYLTNL